MWPNTPLTTYIFDSPPAIKSFDLFSIQDAINQIINGSYSFNSMTVGTSGGLSTTPTSGNMVVTGNITIGGTVPEIVSPGAIFASALVSFDGTATISFKKIYNIMNVGPNPPPVSAFKFAFITPMPNTTYKVITTITNNGGQSYAAIVRNKTINDFVIEFRNPIGNTPQSLTNDDVSIIVTL